MELHGWILTVLALWVAAAAADETMVKAVMKCAADNKINTTSLSNSCDADMTAIPGYKCFTKCVQQMMGIIGEDGSLKPEGSAMFVAEEDKEVALKTAAECIKEIADTDLCERAAAVNECSRKKQPEIYKKSCIAILAKIMT